MKTTYSRNGRPLPRTIKVFNEDEFKRLGVEELIRALKADKFLRSMVQRVQSRLSATKREYATWIFKPHFLPFRTVGTTTYLGVRGNVCDTILTAQLWIYRPSKKGDPFLDGRVTFSYPHTIFLSHLNGGWNVSLGDDSPMSLASLVEHIEQLR